MSSRQEGDFPALIEPHLRALRRAACRLCRDGRDAEDLVQEVCLKALQSGDALGQKTSLRAWLLRVQFNLFVDGQRRRPAASEPFDDTQLANVDRAEHQLEAGADLAERLQALNRVWPELNKDQQALLAYFAEGYTMAEICAMTGLPLSALKARLHRARVRLGKLLAADQLAPPSAATIGDQ
jgi:RNA polymerase sigma-70 factor (ECF subfamily)